MLISKKRNTNCDVDKSQTFTNHKFFDRFVNLSNIEFPTNEINLINKGFNFNLKPSINQHTLEYLGVETDLALNNIKGINTKYQAAKIIKKHNKSNCKSTDSTSEILMSIKNKITDNDLIFTRADKGKTIIALPKDIYVEKTINFLNSGNYTLLSKDPTEKFQKEIKFAISNSQILTPYDKHKLILMNPETPKLYSLVKLHKDNYPIRPVVSFFTAPSAKLSNKLIELLLNYCKFQPKYTVKNSYELVNNLKNIKINNSSKLVSFDVQNLFPSIPSPDVLKSISNLLDKNQVNPVIKDEILNLLIICLDQNYFKFNDKIYSSKKGLIMGNPVSPILADIFMDEIEKIIHSNNLFKNFLYWYRFVDDILACFNGTNRQLNTFLNFINGIHPNIKFTIEVENSNSINFLDLTITKSNDSHEFSIYHKPSHTDTIIHNNSFHPEQHKLASFNSFIYRLINIPMSKENYQKEYLVIKQIASNNGYNPTIVDKLISKINYKKSINLIYPHIEEIYKYRCLTYLGPPTLDISRLLKKSDIKVSFRTNNNLSKYIKNNKDKTSKEQKCGVYKLTCGSCPKVYIGQTGRTFEKRINEHRRSYLKEKSDSTFATHLLDEKHQFNDNFQILHLENKNSKLNLLECKEINKLKYSNVLLNDQLDLNNSPLLNLFPTHFVH